MTINLMTTSFWENEGQLSKSDQLIWNEITKQGLEGVCFSPREVDVIFKGDECKIFVRGQQLPPDGILLVRLMRGAPQRAYEIAQLYESLGGTVSDPVPSLVYSAGKLLPYIKRKGKISYIPSYFFNTKTITIDRLLEVMSYPFVIKPQEGFQGKGVSLIKTPEDYSKFIEDIDDESLIAQNYVADIDAEFRVTVINGKAVGVIRKRRPEGANFLANLDTDEAVSDEEVVLFAEKAASLGEADIYGADVARTSSGELLIIENNRCPDIVSFSEATSVNVAGKIVEFLQTKS